MSTRNAKTYTSAVEQIFAILERAWEDPETGAQSVTKAVTGIEWNYIPALMYPGRERTRYAGQIHAEARYQTDVESRIAETQRYLSVGRVGIHVRYARNDSVDVKVGRLLAELCQRAFRKAQLNWIEFENSKIIEVGYMRGYYQINVYVTCKFEVVVQL